MLNLTLGALTSVNNFKNFAHAFALEISLLRPSPPAPIFLEQYREDRQT